MNDVNTVTIIHPFSEYVPDECIQDQVVAGFQKAAEKAAPQGRVPVWPPRVTSDAHPSGVPEREGIHYVACRYDTVEAVVP